jgi:hypothetical protein
MKWIKRFALLGGLFLLLCGVLMLVAPIRERVLWHGNNLYIRVRYALFPPENAVFVPNAETGSQLPATPTNLPPTETPAPSSTPEPDVPTPTNEPTATPLPDKVSIQGVKYFNQHDYFNYCAPSNLAMELSYWGWSGDRTDVGKFVKPYEPDKNVMPYELADYVRTQTNLGVAQRSGGTLAILKGLLAGGFPVLVERGAYMLDLTNRISWMGHYQVVTGYDDGAQTFITQDSFYHADYLVPYGEMEEGWRAFNYVFLVVYSPDKEADLLRLLGPLADETKAFQTALDTASKEIYSTQGNDQFFAWYNRGTSLVNLQDFNGAAAAFDQAFQLYATLPAESSCTRPSRQRNVRGGWSGIRRGLISLITIRAGITML